jgi:hypothetical protein
VTGRRIARLGFFAGLLAGVPAPLTAQAVGGAIATWQIEVVGGVSGIAPDDLNGRVAYDTTVVDYLRTARIQQDHQGSLVELSRANPFDVRALRRLTRHWSVGGGFSVVSTRRSSFTRASYAYTVVDPRAQEFVRDFSQTIEVDPLVLEVKEYVPHGLVRYDLSAGRHLRVGATFQAGWTVADCKVASAGRTVGGTYAIDHQTGTTMTGSGGGFAGDALAFAHLALTTRFGVILEGGYAWHRAKTVTGTLTTTTRVQDGEATELELDQTTEATGRWINQPTTVQTNGGTWQGTIPSIGTAGTPFTLSLSGWTMRVGAAVGF